MFSQKLDDLLDEYMVYIKTIQDFNQKIKAFEELGIETPENIVFIINRWNAATNLLLVNSECIVVANSFNLSQKYLHKIFFSKVIFKVIHETFELLKQYNKVLFKNEDYPDESKKIKNDLKKFLQDYDENYIKTIRNKTSSHYTPDFPEHIEITTSFDISKAGKMFMDFLAVTNEITFYLVVP